MKIEILYFEGCPHHGLAKERVRKVLGELGIQAEVVHVEVKDEEAARKIRFAGSPTIRVNGSDVAPSEHDEEFGMRCRVYATASGFEGAPDRKAIRAAIKRSAA